MRILKSEDLPVMRTVCYEDLADAEAVDFKNDFKFRCLFVRHPACGRDFFMYKKVK